MLEKSARRTITNCMAEIAALHAAAQHKRYGQVADLLEKLSPKAIRFVAQAEAKPPTTHLHRLAGTAPATHRV